MSPRCLEAVCANKREPKYRELARALPLPTAIDVGSFGIGENESYVIWGLVLVSGKCPA